MTDPALRPIMIEESQSSPSLVRIIDTLPACLPDLPPEIRTERDDLARQLLVHMVARSPTTDESARRALNFPGTLDRTA